jgi:hypothetical protein
MCYSRTPYFRRYFDGLRDIYRGPSERLAELSIALIDFLNDAFGIDTRTVRTTSLGLDQTLQSTEMIIQILRRVRADTYLSGPSGRKYLDLGLFEQEGITVQFQKFEHPRYRQLFGDFVPNMAAIDLLFNEGERAAALVAGRQG